MHYCFFRKLPNPRLPMMFFLMVSPVLWPDAFVLSDGSFDFDVAFPSAPSPMLILIFENIPPLVGAGCGVVWVIVSGSLTLEMLPSLTLESAGSNSAERVSCEYPRLSLMRMLFTTTSRWLPGPSVPSSDDNVSIKYCASMSNLYSFQLAIASSVSEQ